MVPYTTQQTLGFTLLRFFSDEINLTLCFKWLGVVMKVIGLIGNMSYESIASYYQLINQIIKK